MAKNIGKPSGMSTLVLVFIIATLISMIIFVLHPISLLAARRASQIINTQSAFFAAEGAIYETIQHLKDNSDWPGSFPYSDPSPYQLGDALIKREITKDEVSKMITIDITATVKKAKRRLAVNLSYISISEEKKPLDVCLAIDKSYSMDDFGTSPKEEPFSLAKDIAKEIVRSLSYTGDENTTDKVAIVSFAERKCDTAHPDYDLALYEGESDDLAAIEDVIDNEVDFAGCYKSLTKAIVGCRCVIFGHDYNGDCTSSDHARSEAQQVIMVISDGHADTAWPGQPACSRYSCPSSAASCNDGVYDPGKVPCQPDGTGNLCTHSAINEANYFRNEYDYQYASLYIPNLTNSACSERLARRTMEKLANGGFPYFQEIRNYDDLAGLDVDTLHDLLTAQESETGERIITSVFGLYEEIPEPD